MIEALVGIVVGFVAALILRYLKSLVGVVEMKYPTGNTVALLRYCEDGQYSFWHHDILSPHCDDGNGVRRHFIRMNSDQVAVFIQGNPNSPTKKVEYTFFIGCERFDIPIGQSIKDYIKSNGWETKGFVWPRFFQDNFLR